MTSLIKLKRIIHSWQSKIWSQQDRWFFGWESRIKLIPCLPVIFSITVMVVGTYTEKEPLIFQGLAILAASVALIGNYFHKRKKQFKDKGVCFRLSLVGYTLGMLMHFLCHHLMLILLYRCNFLCLHDYLTTQGHMSILCSGHSIIHCCCNIRELSRYFPWHFHILIISVGVHLLLTSSNRKSINERIYYALTLMPTLTLCKAAISILAY